VLLIGSTSLLGLVSQSAFAQAAASGPSEPNAQPDVPGQTVAGTANAPAIESGTNDVVSADGTGGDIVVTGTRIKGVAPVGSPVIPVGRQDILKSGLGTTNDVLRKIPQVVNLGGGEQLSGGANIQGSTLDVSFASTVNLRGLGPASTLSLVNGHRVAPQGGNAQIYDSDNIPAIALERVEVVADGGSAIYGSDAIAGVVNYIIRRPQNVAETSVRAAFADGLQQYMVDQTFGRQWGTGGFFVAYEYQNKGALKAKARPGLYNSDLSPYGGALSPTFANPGNVILGANAGPYAIPEAQDGKNLTLGNLLTGQVNRENVWNGTDAIPSSQRHTIIGNFEQDVSPGIKIVGDAYFSRRAFQINQWATDSTLSVPNTNPYSPCAVGKPRAVGTLTCPADGTVTVPYSFLQDLGPLVRKGYERSWEVSGGVNANLFANWTASVQGYYSQSKEFYRAIGTPNTTALATALSGTDPANIFNPFCDGTQFNCNNDAVIDLINGFNEVGTTYAVAGGTANFSGSLFSLPGGAVRLAFGGEYHHDVLNGISNNNTRTASVATVSDTSTSNKRSVKSLFAELYVPVIGASNAVPGIARLELSGAVRYDKYSDVGSTTNPKFGINYSPVHGLTLHGTYGKSFRAPSLVDANPYSTAGFLISNISGADIGTTPGQQQFLYQVGGNAGLKPETATTYSFGFDVAPALIHGLNASVSYYNIKYTNKIDTAPYNISPAGLFNTGFYDDFIVYNPAYFPTRATMTQAQFNAYYANAISNPNLPVFGPPPASPVGIIDARRNNQGVVETNGFDFSASYVIDGNWANYRIGGQANYILHYKQAPVPSAPLVDQINHFGYPLRFVGRGELGIDKGNFSATGFVNFTNSYTITRDFLPASIPDKYKHIDSNMTFDLTLIYSMKDEPSNSLFKGLTFIVSVQNLFDKAPPLVVNNGIEPIRFDPANASAIGRFVSFQITKSF